jgi:tRNA 2-thiouridine synthesizing protein A
MMDSSEFFGRTLDARTLYCPEPVMLLHNMIRDISHGEKIRVLATDQSTKRDIP